MRSIFLPYLRDIRFSGDTGKDADLFLRAHALYGTADHCRDVALEARRLAACLGAGKARAEKAGWLHDISAVIPSSQRVQLARALEIEVLPEEAACPMILHQKISARMASEIFCIQDMDICSAIGCHTTLKAGASTLDKVV
ncbi:MAG: HD domain-containing protein, partial [Omnitrophica WOR_2 bacterium]